MHPRPTSGTRARNGNETPASARVTANVRAELDRRQMKQSSFAARLGWSPAATSRRLNGQTRWGIDEVDAVAALFGIDVTDLLAEERAA